MRQTICALFEEIHKIDLRRDLGQPLGNEVLVALDGPILPKPSWKVVFEVERCAPAGEHHTVGGHQPESRSLARGSFPRGTWRARPSKERRITR